MATRWNKFVLIKVNVSMWHFMLDRLPIRSNLIDKGVELDSVLCLICQQKILLICFLVFACSTCLALCGFLDGFVDSDLLFLNGFGGMDGF